MSIRQVTIHFLFFCISHVDKFIVFSINTIMEKQELENYIQQGLSFIKIAKLTNKSLTSVRYWAKKYKLQSKFKQFKDKEKKEYENYRFCSKCKKNILTKNFYSRRGKEFSSAYCKICINQQAIERQRQNKAFMVEYKGGKCQICGYNKSIAALEFHHIDPSKKEFTLAHIKKRKMDEAIKQELDKCLLLCANCHRELHEKLNSEKYSIKKRPSQDSNLEPTA